MYMYSNCKSIIFFVLLYFQRIDAEDRRNQKVCVSQTTPTSLIIVKIVLLATRENEEPHDQTMVTRSGGGRGGTSARVTS